MSMISKQIELLRSQAEYEYRILKDKLMAKLLSQAADTIEMLSEKAREPKRGEWIEVESYEYETHSVTDMRCNLCGKYSQMVLPFQTKCVYPRCPFCGAKMKGADDEV